MRLFDDGLYCGPEKPATCRVCGCTDDDCRGCIERTGEPCYWREDLETEDGPICSACTQDHRSPESQEDAGPLWWSPPMQTEDMCF